MLYIHIYIYIYIYICKYKSNDSEIYTSWDIVRIHKCTSYEVYFVISYFEYLVPTIMSYILYLTYLCA